MRAGDSYDRLYFVQSGFAAAEFNTETGDNHVSMIISSGFIIPYDLPTSKSLSDINIICLTEVHFTRIDRSIFRKMIENHPELRQNVMDYLRKIISIQNEFIFVLTSYDNLEKVAWALSVVFLGYYGITHKINRLPIAQIMIAENLKISRQSVNEALQSLKELGAVEIARSQVGLLDLDKLRSVFITRRRANRELEASIMR